MCTCTNVQYMWLSYSCPIWLSYSCPIVSCPIVVLYGSYTGSPALYGKANTEQRRKNKQTVSNATL